MKRGQLRSRNNRPTDALLKLLLPIAILLAVPCLCLAQSTPVKHAVTVTFDYDFTVTHACSAAVTKKCVAQFNVYDISGGKPYKLFTISAPSGAKGPVKGISGDSQPLLFESGKHLFAVTAQTAGGEESSPRACSTWASVP
jgi:hypothetical protein